MFIESFRKSFAFKSWLLTWSRHSSIQPWISHQLSGNSRKVFILKSTPRVEDTMKFIFVNVIEGEIFHGRRVIDSFFSKNKPRNTYRRDCYAFLSGNSWHFTHRRHFSQFLWKEKYLLRFPHIRKRLWRHTMWGKLLFLALKQMINVRYMRTKAPRVEFYIRDLVFNPMNGKFSIFFLLVFCFSFVVITIIVVVVVVLRQRNILKLLIHLL